MSSQDENIPCTEGGQCDYFLFFGRDLHCCSFNDIDLKQGVTICKKCGFSEGEKRLDEIFARGARP